jgi:predicted kinase
MPRDRPTLVVVSGPAGSGKTTLAHGLAAALRCPAICRDEIKEGMAHAAGTYEPEFGDDHAVRTLMVFFDVLHLLLERGVSVVAEAAFQDHVWTPRLAPLTALGELRIVQCHVDPGIAKQRIVERAPSRSAHPDAALLASLEQGDDYFTNFNRVAIDAPTIDVDTSDGYQPSIEAVVAFIDVG